MYIDIYLHMLIYEYIYLSLIYGVLFGSSALESEGCMSLRNAGKLPATHRHIPEGLNCEFARFSLLSLKLQYYSARLTWVVKYPPWPVCYGVKRHE